jgi:CheY-like chemotaxis protein
MATTVLVADDDAEVRAFLAALLAEEGYVVVQAADGASALERLRQHPTGLVVLLDLHMPIVSGFDVLHAVDADAALSRRHAYVVLSSAQTSELSVDLLQLLERRDIPLIAKPCDLDALVTAVGAAAQCLAGGARPECARDLVAPATVRRK